MQPAFDPQAMRLHYFNAPNPHGAEGTHRLAVYEWGSPESPPILCIHGLTRNGRDFDFLARELASQYRVIAIDVAGRGKSDYFKDVRWYDNGVYLQDILAVAEWMNIQKFDWIGTSMGGIIGMTIASLMPEKINRLVLNDVGAFIPLEGLFRIMQYVGKKPRFDTFDEAERYLRTIMQPFGISDDLHWRHVLDHTLTRNEDGSVMLAYDPRIAEAFKIAISAVPELDNISLWMFWETIKCPTLILRGGDSDILPADVAHKMRDTHPNATLVEFKGVGHAPTLLEDSQIQAVTDWLEANPLTAA